MDLRAPFLAERNGGRQIYCVGQVGYCDGRDIANWNRSLDEIIGRQVVHLVLVGPCDVLDRQIVARISVVDNQTTASDQGRVGAVQAIHQLLL